MEPPSTPARGLSLASVLPVDGAVELAARKNGILEMTFPFFPYPLRLGLREEMPLFAEVKGRRSKAWPLTAGFFWGRVSVFLFTPGWALLDEA